MLDGTCVEHFIPCQPREEGGFSEKESLFFEAASPRKVGDTYYMNYSPKRGSRLAYATSLKPTGPFAYRGWIVDNGVDYHGGNNHGSIACIGGQWYIFYHRMTNGTIMSRRGCVERIEILPGGTRSFSRSPPLMKAGWLHSSRDGSSLSSSSLSS